MQVQIVSIQAALHGRPSIVWIGDVTQEDLAEAIRRDPLDEGEVNEALFRFFNRVDDPDVDRLAEVGFELPSLSVGDLLHWGSKTFRVAGSGFEQITDSAEYAMALTAYTLKTMGGEG